VKSYTVNQADEMAQFVKAVFEYASHDDKMFRDDDVLNLLLDTGLCAYASETDEYFLEDWV